MNHKKPFWPVIAFLIMLCMFGCKSKVEKPLDIEKNEKASTAYFNWKGATVYFLLTDRFNNGDPSNDINFERTKETALLRGFKGGDLKGVIQKIKEGYFNDLGVNAIWMTPIMEQVHEGVDEGTGFTYPFHGYWMKDWTALDPNFGSKDDLKELVTSAHERGIRVLLDAVINHTGPATDQDPAWPEEWVRQDPTCTYKTYESIVHCTLVDNLPDLLTEKNEAVTLPPTIVEKWKKEGRYEEELAELDAFFNETGYPKAPRFYIMKWLSDYVEEYGIDGYRVDTARNTEIFVWEEFRQVCDRAFSNWKKEHPEQVLDENDFYMVGECYGYSINTGTYFDIGDQHVNYFNDSFNALINFDLKTTQDQPLENVFHRYDSIIQNEPAHFGTLSYLNSHDDVNSYDTSRDKPYESAIRLLLAPGGAQIYYGDESARPLNIEGTQGDATLRSFMNWEDIASNQETQNILDHWQKIGAFRARHFAVGAGAHKVLSSEPFTFSRTLTDGNYSDQVVIALDAPMGPKEISVEGVYADGTTLRDGYSNTSVVVKDGKVVLDSQSEIVLLELAD